MSEQLMDYFVVGFAFSKDRTSILLIEKNRPPWQKGFLNGVGGRIEEDEDTETPYAAMYRETMEETGLKIGWFHRGVMGGTNNDGRHFTCHIFYAYDDSIYDFQQREDEKLKVYEVGGIMKRRVIANLHFLIPFGLCDDGSKFITLKY